MTNGFTSSAEYYDIIYPPKEFLKDTRFLTKLFKKHKIKTILKLGCGTGSYIIPLKKAGFKIEGLDISKHMLSILKKKSNIKIYNKDMSNFKISKKYNAIICLNTSLLYLPNYKSIESTIKNMRSHLNSNGFIVIDIPNLKKEISELNNHQESQNFKLKNGNLNIIFRDYKKHNKWICEWHGFVKQGNKFKEFKDHYEELIFPRKKLEKTLKQNNFKILKIYGSCSGLKFNEKTSERIVYFCKLN